LTDVVLDPCLLLLLQRDFCCGISAASVLHFTMYYTMYESTLRCADLIQIKLVAVLCLV